MFMGNYGKNDQDQYIESCWLYENIYSSVLKISQNLLVRKFYIHTC